MLVEVCANSLESALNAEKAGADRIELCAELGVGGITPSYGLIALVKEHLSIPVHVLIRPRSGHFTYSDTEFQVLLNDIKYCKELGVAGIVSGVLNTDATIDIKRTEEIVKLAEPLHFTFHRAFDWVPNPQEALEELKQIGVNTILTSGGASTAEKGVAILETLHRASDNITIMAGAGVNFENIQLLKKTDLTAVHLSGTVFVNKIETRDKISMNSEKHLVAHQVAVTNETIIRQIVQHVK